MLYSGNAAFFYGVYVESARLCFAAEAYSKQKKSIHALNLISARQRNNLLRRVGDSKGSVTKVSDQIWKMIKVEIIRIAMNKAERNDLKGNRNGKASWEEIESTSELKSAYGGHGKNSAIEMMLYRREGQLVGLMMAIELAVPTSMPFSLEDYSGDDPHTLTPVGLPQYATDKPASPQWPPQASTPYAYDRGPLYGTLRYSQKFFDLPSDANERLHNFLTLFSLESKDPKCRTAYTPHQNETRIAQSKKGKKPRTATHKSRCCSNEMEPHWYLAATASHDDDLHPENE